MSERLRPGQPRSRGAIPRRRVTQDWPRDRRFRILAVDGGGIRGIFPAAVLAGLERRHAGGQSVAAYFDLIAGTSTGGILGLGLGAGLTAVDVLELYMNRGAEIFPPFGDGRLERLRRRWHAARRWALYRHDQKALERILTETRGDRLFGSASTRLCVPAFDGRHGEVYMFKTPHHPDYKTDRHERMVKVALATAAAPTYYKPLEDGGYVFVDGGVWANNPVMLAVVEALTCFDVSRDQIDVLSIGCGDDPYVVSGGKITLGGLLPWHDVMFAAMRLQSLAATNQARLLLGPPAVVRLDVPTNNRKMALDDWHRASRELPPAAEAALMDFGQQIAKQFFYEKAEIYSALQE